MAKGGGSKGGGRPRRPSAVPRRKPAAASQRKPPAPRASSAQARRGEQAAPLAEAAASAGLVFRLGIIPGATPGKWVQLWRERMPQVPLELVPLTVAAQGDELRADHVDAAIVRLPLEADDLHVIALYDEVPVVVTSADSSLTVAEELDVDDLIGEVRLVPSDDVIAAEIPGTVAPDPALALDTEEAIATVAAGVGVVVVPMSLARLHARKDVAHRPLRGGPVSTVALAWPAARTTAHVETFIGIVRGRTANSSR